MTTRHKGTLTQWNEARGFGFIEPAEGGERVFCHARALRDRDARAANGIRVTYALGRDDRGRPRAGDVWLSMSTRTAPRASASPQSRISIAIVGSALFLLVVVALVVAGKLTMLAIPWYLVLSLGTFFAYGVDKTAARQNRRRTPERVLQALALAGGWPGAWIAQQTIRHKSSKWSFQIGFWLSVAGNIAALAAIVSSGGEIPAEWLRG
jgi:uncharacterized membrane protein YsdA (DUF1294 family)/cold shock CspA family protein